MLHPKPHSANSVQVIMWWYNMCKPLKIEGTIMHTCKITYLAAIAAINTLIIFWRTVHKSFVEKYMVSWKAVQLGKF